MEFSLLVFDIIIHSLTDFTHYWVEKSSSKELLPKIVTLVGPAMPNTCFQKFPTTSVRSSVRTCFCIFTLVNFFFVMRSVRHVTTNAYVYRLTESLKVF